VKTLIFYHFRYFHLIFLTNVDILYFNILQVLKYKWLNQILGAFFMYDFLTHLLIIIKK
jgi:hypothetical protein